MFADLGEVPRDLAAGAVEDREQLGRVRYLREDPDRPSEQQPGEVSLLAVRGNDAVREDEVQRSRVVDQDRRFAGRERSTELVVLRAKDRLVGRPRTLARPDEPFEPVAGVDHRERHRLQRLPVANVLHEHERRQLEARGSHAQGRPEVPAAFPDLLLVGDRLRVGAQLLREELVAELDRPLLEVDLVVRPVERVVGHHLEEGHVAPAPPDLLEVDEPEDRLRDRQRVRGRRDRPARHPRLEVVDRGLREEDVVPPPGDGRVPADPRVAPTLEEAQERLAHGAQLVRPREQRFADESVLAARGLLAPVVVAQRPERLAAAAAGASVEPLAVEEREVVLGEVHGRSRTSLAA